MIRASVICIAAFSLFQTLPAADSAQAGDTDATSTRVLTAEKSTGAPASEVQKVQRLLKFLSQRNPARFGKVDPGPVDGVYGAEVKAAIIRFQRIVGAPTNSVIDRELLSQIISALAETPDASETALVGCAENPGNPACRDAQPKPSSAPAKAETEPPKPRIVTRMFVQLASLPSMARAKREWRRLRRTNEYVLGDAEVQYRQVEIKGRGTYFRVFVGPYENMADARNVCVGLGREGRNCIVIRRKMALTPTPPKPAAAPVQADKAAAADPSPKPETPSEPAMAADAPSEASAEKAESAETPTKPETPSKPAAAAELEPAAPSSPKEPDGSKQPTLEILALTLQAPVLTPGAAPRPAPPI